MIIIWLLYDYYMIIILLLYDYYMNIQLNCFLLKYAFYFQFFLHFLSFSELLNLNGGQPIGDLNFWECTHQIPGAVLYLLLYSTC